MIRKLKGIRPWSALSLTLASMCLAACVPLAPQGGYGGYNSSHHPNQGGGYQQAGPVIHDISGDWSFGAGKVNRFQRTNEGYYVTPVGRGRAVHYVEIGINLYQDANGPGTYEVVGGHELIWRSNNKKNSTIRLYR